MKLQPLWKTVWRFLKKLKTELFYDPVIALLGIYPQNTKTLIQRDICTCMFIATLFTIAKLWKQPKCLSIDEWIKKMWDICNGILFSHEKEWNLAICHNMDGTREYNAKWNKSVGKRKIPYDFTHMWNLRHKISKGTKRERERQRNRLLT